MRPPDDPMRSPSGRRTAAAPDPRVLRAMDLEAHLADPSIKQQFVTPMFDVIAPRYDRFTRLFSFGMDRGWKRELLTRIEELVTGEATVLDLACGTGDLALEVSARVPAARVTGVDASPAMIDHARRRRSSAVADRVQFVVGDMARLEAPDESVDLITAGYALRYAPDLSRAIAE